MTAVSSATDSVRPGLVREEAKGGMCGLLILFFQVLGISKLEIIQEMAVALRGQDVLWMEDEELDIF